MKDSGYFDFADRLGDFSHSLRYWPTQREENRIAHEAKVPQEVILMLSGQAHQDL
jgi:hypothetical protein